MELSVQPDSQEVTSSRLKPGAEKRLVLQQETAKHLMLWTSQALLVSVK